MISGFPKPWKPVFIHFFYKITSNMQEIMGTSCTKNMFISQLFGNPNIRHFRKDWHREMMKNRQTNLENLGYETNIYQKHKWIFANMVYLLQNIT